MGWRRLRLRNKMTIDKLCRYCKKDRVRSSSGYVVCDCQPAQEEWRLEIERELLKKRLSFLGKELSELKDKHTTLNEEAK